MNFRHFNSRRASRKNQRRARLAPRNRRIFIESLENRILLASDWQNPVFAKDVNDDGHITALDVVMVINRLQRDRMNQDGAELLPALSVGERPEAFYDTTGDGFLSARDALISVNALDDVVARLETVTPLSDSSFLLTFANEVPGDFVEPANFSVTFCSDDVPCSAENLQSVEILAASVNAAGNEVTLTTPPPPNGGRVIVSAGGGPEGEGNAIDATTALSFRSALPRIVGAASTDNTTVRVSFSEPVQAAGAEDKANYVITQKNVNPEAGRLLIVEAKLDADDPSNVILTTLSQSELIYEVNVINVRDVSGNPLATPLTNDGVLVDPTRAIFPGTPPMGPTLLDSDGDGLSDNEEQRGWIVTVRLAAGAFGDGDRTFTSRGVTSDPNNKDSDGDGVSDLQEKVFLSDPRDTDTDDDELSDFQELNEIYTDPFDQDSDNDGLPDGLEHNFFKTSPLLADTDGDQFTDDQEVITDLRSPRLADRPSFNILTGDVDLRLDVRFESQNTTGTSTLESKSITTSLQQSEESSQSRENSSTTEWFAKAGVCFGGACASDGGGIADTFVKKSGFEAEAGGGGSHTATFSTASARASQREHESSLSTDQETSAESTTVRHVEGATMGVEVNIVNTGNLSFSMSNIEVTALIQDLGDPTKFIPVATLFPVLNEPISIGPLSPERGPFRFKADEAFPDLVDSLMQNPRGLLFQVANYDITDEVGRNFSFVDQDINDRTAFLEIDYAGNLPLEKHYVATNSVFKHEENGDVPGLQQLRIGESIGLTMTQVMEEILGLKRVSEADDLLLDPTDPDDADLIDRSYSTRMIKAKVRTNPTVPVNENDASTFNEVDREILFRVKNVSETLTKTKRKWWVLTPQGLITPANGAPGADFSDVRFFAGQDFALKFIQDIDEDRLEASQERLYRSVDSIVDKFKNGEVDNEGAPTGQPDGIVDSKDSDNDGIDDGSEVYGFFVGNRPIGWTIHFDDGQDSYKTSSNPGRADSDNDGLTDCQELAVEEKTCSLIEVWLDEKGVPTLQQPTFLDGSQPDAIKTLRLPSPTDPSKADTDGDGLTDGTEVAGFKFMSLIESMGEITLVPRTDDDGQVLPATNPLSVDTDNDTLSDFRERRLGTNPTVSDKDSVLDDDGDGLVNLEETTGWTVEIEGPTVFVDDFESRFGFVGNWERSITNGFDGDLAFTVDEFDANTDQRAAWVSPELPAGTYRVSTTWDPQQGAARVRLSTSVLYSVLVGTGNSDSGFVDQTQAPDDFIDAGAGWEDLGGPYTVASGETITVVVQAEELNPVTSLQQLVLADAIRIERLPQNGVVQSDPKKNDSDADGLTDWEEFKGCRDRNRDQVCDSPDVRFGSTNPNAADTDGDGLTDRQEVDGVPFPAGDEKNRRITDPQLWDSDSDGRSDHDEINVSWDVKVTGKSVQTVFSDPLKKDADGDGLSDGDEFELGTHPNVADTDGDEILDGLEIQQRSGNSTNPLTPDRLVRVTFVDLIIGKIGDDKADGDSNKNAGDIQFEFQVGHQRPATGFLELTTVTEDQDMTITQPGTTELLLDCKDAPGASIDQDKSLCRSSHSDGQKFIQITSLDVLNLNKSQSFRIDLTDIFTIQGHLRDSDNNDRNSGRSINKQRFGGLGSEDGVFKGSDITSQAFVFKLEGSSDTNPKTVTAEITGTIEVLGPQSR